MRKKSEMQKRIVILLALLGVCVAVSACASNQRTNELPVAVSALRNANPNAEGQASPITVILYQLNEKEAFYRVGYQDIFRGGAPFEGAVLGKKEVHLSPGRKKTLRWTIDQDAHFVGVAAGFQLYDTKRWRVVQPVPSKKLRKHELVVVVTDAGLELDFVR